MHHFLLLPLNSKWALRASAVSRSVHFAIPLSVPVCDECPHRTQRVAGLAGIGSISRERNENYSNLESRRGPRGQIRSKATQVSIGAVARFAGEARSKRLLWRRPTVCCVSRRCGNVKSALSRPVSAR